MKIEVPDLITRQLGRVMSDTIIEKMKSMHEGETLLLDFDGIEVVDSSFIDELIIKLLLLSRSSMFPFFIKLKNISNAVEINIDLVFNSYSSFNRDRMAVVTEGLCRNNCYYIGPLSEIERDILGYLRINKSASLDDLCRFTGAGEEEMRRTADELFSMRVIRRDGDTQYVPV
ncbi:MAG: STAS-like domain-containing protein [Spirochaetes bacterium]|nr:STAS-like domain-containing protein [Spirochaetota bacterium]